MKAYIYRSIENHEEEEFSKGSEAYIHAGELGEWRCGSEL
jgi:hypothetical protein